MRSTSVAALLLVAGAASAAVDALPDLAPSVRSLFPLGGRHGESIEVQLWGRNLDGALDITFARSDIRAQVLSAEFFSVKARISIGPNVPVGLHDYRLRTPRGTYVGVFHVSSLPGQRETEPNNDTAHAQKIKLPVMIDGIVENGDYDVFSFHSEAGETQIFDLMATRAGSKLDGTLAILDERGNELDFVDDAYIHKDAFLAFTPKRGGDYFVRVSASDEQSSRYNSYRLSAGPVPHMLRVLPVAARRGSAAEFHLAGFNLQSVDKLVLGESLAEGKVVSAKPDRLMFRMAVPPSVPPGRYQLHAFAGILEAPLQIQMLVSDLDEQLAISGSSRSTPQPIQPPVAVTGILDHRRASGFFSFEAAAGERLEFDVEGMKLGFLLDPVIGLHRPDGSLLVFEDDRLEQNGTEPPNLDPYLVHSFQDSGRYVLQIRDSAERGGPNFVYRIAIRRIEPDFELKVLTPGQTWYRGRTALLPVRVRRNGGWNTPVEVWAYNLPPGITVDKVVAEPKDTIVKDNCALNRRLDGTNVLVPLHIAPDAPVGTFPIRLLAHGTIEGKTVEHTAEMVYRWESVGKVSGPIQEQKLLATVTDLPSAVLDPPESVTLQPGKPARIRVLVTRFDGAKTPLTLVPEPPLPGVKFENNVLQPGASQLELRVTASEAVKAERFSLRAGAAVSPPIELKAQGAAEDSE